MPGPLDRFPILHYKGRKAMLRRVPALGNVWVHLARGRFIAPWLELVAVGESQTVGDRVVEGRAELGVVGTRVAPETRVADEGLHPMLPLKGGWDVQRFVVGPEARLAPAISSPSVDWSGRYERPSTVAR